MSGAGSAPATGGLATPAPSRGVDRRHRATTGRRFVGVVSGLTSVNVLIRASALITGPLMARALGPAGRGELAAILVPFGIAPVIAMLGLGPFAVREVARGRPPGTVLGTVAVPLLCTGALGMILAVPVADYLAEGQQTVRTFLTIGLMLLPLALAGLLLQAVANGLEAWRSLIIARLIPPIAGVIVAVTLYLTGTLTVATAATLTIAVSVISSVPLLARIRPWRQDLRVDRALLRQGCSFGAKAWANQLGSSANARLDQLLMIPIVSRSELGLYAVGVNAASLSGLFTTALAVPLGVRVARGEAHLAARALRMTLWGSAFVAILLAVTIPIVLPLLFGDAFSEASTMAQILLAASIPNAGRSVLAPALTAAGRPGAGAISQTLALVITVPALLLVLPSMGGIGAALVSLVAYSITFTVLLPIARRHLGLGYGELLLPRRGDLHWTLVHLAGAAGAARRRLGRRGRRGDREGTRTPPR